MRKDYSLGLHTNVKQLRMLQNKLLIEYNPDLTKEEIITEFKAAYKKRKKIKIMVDDLSLEYRTKLTMVKRRGRGIESCDFLRNQNIIEKQRRVSRNIRSVEGIRKEGSTTKVMIDEGEVNTTELTSNIEIYCATATSNENLGIK